MRRLLLGVGLAVLATMGWRAISRHAGRPLTELDELYPPARDPYLDDLLNRRMTGDLFPLRIFGGRVVP